MPTFIVERHLPGISEEQLVAAATRAKRTTAQMTEEGTPIRYLFSNFIPGEERCFCLFEGPTVDAVRRANERAQIPFERILAALHVSSDDLQV